MNFLRRNKFYVYLLGISLVVWSRYVGEKETVFERNFHVVIELLWVFLIICIEWKYIKEFLRNIFVSKKK